MPFTTFRNAIHQGFRVTHRNWQLIVIKMIFLVLSLIGFMGVVVFPLIVLFKSLVHDLSDITRIIDFYDFPSRIRSEYVSRGITFVGIGFIYGILVFLADMFIFVASCGMLARGIKSSDRKFTLGDFFLEGRRLFFPFLGFLSLIGFIIMGELFFLLFYFLATSTIMEASAGMATLEIFIKILIRLFTFFLVFFFIFGTLSITSYGLGILSLRGGRIFESLKEAISYVTGKPFAFWFYFLLVTGYLFGHALILIMGSSFSMMDGAGVFPLLLYSIMIYVTQKYLGLLILSSLFSYYAESTGSID